MNCQYSCTVLSVSDHRVCSNVDIIEKLPLPVVINVVALVFWQSTNKINKKLPIRFGECECVRTFIVVVVYSVALHTLTHWLLLCGCCCSCYYCNTMLQTRIIIIIIGSGVANIYGILTMSTGDRKKHTLKNLMCQLVCTYGWSRLTWHIWNWTTIQSWV